MGLSVWMFNIEQHCIRVSQNPCEIPPWDVPTRFNGRINAFLMTSTEEIGNKWGLK